MKLGEDLAQAREAFRHSLSADQWRLYEDAIAAFEANGYPTDSVQTGEMVPDFSLTTTGGAEVRLGDCLDRGPLVITVYLAEHSPFCRPTLKAWASVLPRIRSAGAALLGLSPHRGGAPGPSVDLPFERLHDPGARVCSLFGLLVTVPETSPGYCRMLGIDPFADYGLKASQLPMAATYVVGPDGIARYAFVAADPSLRAEPEDALAVLEAVAAGA